MCSLDIRKMKHLLGLQMLNLKQQHKINLYLIMMCTFIICIFIL